MLTEIKSKMNKEFQLVVAKLLYTKRDIIKELKKTGAASENSASPVLDGKFNERIKGIEDAMI